MYKVWKKCIGSIYGVKCLGIPCFDRVHRCGATWTCDVHQGGKFGCAACEVSGTVEKIEIHTEFCRETSGGIIKMGAEKRGHQVRQIESSACSE